MPGETGNPSGPIPGEEEGETSDPDVRCAPKNRDFLGVRALQVCFCVIHRTGVILQVFKFAEVISQNIISRIRVRKFQDFVQSPVTWLHLHPGRIPAPKKRPPFVRMRMSRGLGRIRAIPEDIIGSCIQQ